MGLFTPDINNLRELYTTLLQRSLSSEKQIVEDGLPAMIESSSHPALANAFRTHLAESQEHVSRLRSILDENEGEANESKCKVTATLISEGGSLAKGAKAANIRDVVLIAAGNQIEHHEIAVYGTLVNLATILGEAQHATMLKKTLEEEKKADAWLSEVAEQVNVEAVAA